MVEIFSDLPEALENNQNIPLRCSYRPLTSKPMLPNFITESSNVDDELKSQAKSGLAVKLKDFILNNISDLAEKDLVRKKYEDRLNYEVEMISKMKFS